MTVETFTTSGNGTWTAPAGVTSVVAECWGGGGWCPGLSTFGSGGGGGGGYSKKTITVTPSNNYSYHVGAGGSFSLGSGDGEDTWFSNTNTVRGGGGFGGVEGTVGAGTGGTGGTGANGATNFNGGNGGDGSASGGCGGGGSSAGTASNGVNGSNGTAADAAGATAPAGGGNGGGPATGGPGVTPGGGAGSDGSGGGPMAGATGKIVLTYTAVNPPVANFSGTPTFGTTPLSVVFTDSSTNTPTSWLWEKNNGSGWSNFSSGATSQNPTESFTTGTWSVRLTATNADGSNTKTSTDYITVTSSNTVRTTDGKSF